MPRGVYERKIKNYPSMIIDCETCGVKVRVSATSKRVPKFCSSVCFGRSLKKEEKGQAKICGFCGCSFRGRERANVCSPACRANSKKVENPKWESVDYRRAYHRNYAHIARAKGKFDTASLKAKADSELRKSDMDEIIKKADGACVYCGSPSVKLTIDHVTPIFFGGEHETGNLIPCCKSCNSSKGTRDVADWLYSKHGVLGLARAHVFLTEGKIRHEFY